MPIITQPSGSTFVSVNQRHLDQVTREWANAHGIFGSRSGWIGRPESSRCICQGWDAFRRIYGTQIKDALTAELTASRTFSELLTAPGHYRPTLLARSPRDWKYVLLADLYDEAQAARKDPRRAYRGVRGAAR